MIFSMTENHRDDYNNKELLEEACRFIESMVDKKIASQAQADREASRHQSRNTWAGIALVVVTLFIGGAGLIFKAYAENQDRDDQTMREANRRKLEIISGISGAITSIRELKDVALTYCGTKRSDEYKQQLKVDRVKRGYQLIYVGRPKMHFFGNRFRVLLREFLKWEEEIVDYCDPSAPSDAEWLRKQQEIEDQMVLSPAITFVDSKF